MADTKCPTIMMNNLSIFVGFFQLWIIIIIIILIDLVWSSTTITNMPPTTTDDRHPLFFLAANGAGNFQEDTMPSPSPLKPPADDSYDRISKKNISKITEEAIFDPEKQYRDEEENVNIKMSEYLGDIMLGAVFPIHQREANYSCGCIQMEGIQQLEAMNFVLDRINNDPNILPGIRLGALAIDSCDNPHHALEQAIDFMKSFVARSNRRLVKPEFHCQDHSAPKYKDGRFDRIFGIIGGQSSEVSLQLANLLRLFHVPQVSYMSTSPTLSDKRLYEYFFRTVPSDTNQVDAIVDILRKFNWTYVSVVYSDTEYGNNGYDLLSTAAARYNICISSPQAINVERFHPVDYDNLITTLMHKINARVVIVYTDGYVARKIMKAAKRQTRIDRFVWIASDAWCCRESVVQGLEPILEGAISVTPLHYPLHGFVEYFGSLRPRSNKKNPWWDEYWEKHFKCRLVDESTTTISTIEPDGQQPPPELSSSYESIMSDQEYSGEYSYFSSNNNNNNSNGGVSWEQKKKKYRRGTRPLCNETMSFDDDLKQSPSLHFVRDAFYSFANTFHQIHRKICNGKPGLCDRMRDLLSNGPYVSNQLKQIRFRDEGGRMFRFQNNGDAPPRYTVVNFQLLENGTYHWRPVGDYMIAENETRARLRMDMALLKYKQNSEKFPKSFCSEPCSIGQAKLQLEGDTCCWLCTNCSQYQYLVDEFHCLECPLGTLPNSNKTECLPVPTIYLSLTEWWTIAAMAFAIIGMICTILTWLVFHRYRETPIIKAAGRELSYLHLTGIFLSFAVTFVIVAKPTPLTCWLTRFFLGFCYTVCYSAIVTKTNRISRIFTHRSCQKLKFTSPQSQLVITTLLIMIEVLIMLIWFFYDPPDIKLVYSTREIALLICSRSDSIIYLIGLVYPLILIGFCTVYAFKTRKCPEGFNEARYITFTNYTTCVIWFAFLPLYVMLSTTTPLRSITLSSLLSVSGAVQLSCLFVPKIYIALLKPEKNTRETVMCGGTRSLVFSSQMPPSLMNPHHHHHHHHPYHRPLGKMAPKQVGNGHAHGNTGSGRKPIPILEPYSTSSEIDTTATTATVRTGRRSSQSFRQNGSISSVPDRYMLPNITACTSPSGSSSSSSSSSNDDENQLQDRKISNNIEKTNNNIRSSPTLSTSSSVTINGKNCQLPTNSEMIVTTKKIMMISEPVQSSSVSASANGNGIIKHDTKAILENGHQRWPSIKLDATTTTGVAVQQQQQ